MKTKLLGLVAAALLAGGAGTATAPAAPPVAVAVAAKTCSGGYVHAVINGSQKCLRRGQFCAHAADRQYHRYGFHCHKRDANGSYHLT